MMEQRLGSVTQETSRFWVAPSSIMGHLPPARMARSRRVRFHPIRADRFKTRGRSTSRGLEPRHLLEAWHLTTWERRASMREYWRYQASEATSGRLKSSREHF